MESWECYTLLMLYPHDPRDTGVAAAAASRIWDAYRALLHPTPTKARDIWAP